MLRSARAAFMFLTRVPMGGFPYSPGELRDATGHFPLVGAALGAAQAGLLLLVAPLYDGAIAATLAVIASLLLTGAFHEDGLADTADALGGGFTRERVLEILKDSRIGTFGGAALVGSQLLRVLLLARLALTAPWAVVMAECWSRAVPVLAMTLLPYATDPERSRSRELSRAGAKQVVTALLHGAWVGAVLFGSGAAAPHRAALGLALALGAGAIALWRFRARVGGLTGDFLGALQQLALLGLLLGLASP